MNLIQRIAAGLAIAAVSTGLLASPEDDLEAFQGFFHKRFPDVSNAELGNGVYAIDPVGRANWEAIEEFPPYEPMIDQGHEMWDKPFANGKHYKDCLPDGPALGKDFPHWDKKSGRVVTLPLALNECREVNGEKPLPYNKGKLASLLAYLAFESRGQLIDVKIPQDDPRALEAYEKGKHFYFARRGQLNFSCATCHMQSTGMRIRSEILSPALGQATHWPVYRSKWGELGTLHRRFGGCNKNVRAKAFPAQSEEYRDLEYFLTYMNNGLPLNGPAARK